MLIRLFVGTKTKTKRLDGRQGRRTVSGGCGKLDFVGFGGGFDEA